MWKWHHPSSCAFVCFLYGLGLWEIEPAVLRGQESGSFENVTGKVGIVYRRAPSAAKALFDTIKNDPPYTREKQLMTPIKAWGGPGVAIFDAEGDGDLDLFVTNGPGVSNSLFLNELAQTGTLRFEDRGAASGAGAEDMDGSGVCFGDLDNDGDPDLLVLSPVGANRLFENSGRLSPEGVPIFDDVTTVSGIAAGEPRVSSGCSMGDVDGDGFLDIVIGNTYDDWSHSLGLQLEPFVLNQHNRLFLSTGGFTFVDVSASMGIEDLAGIPKGVATLTWAVALVDLDLDGDVDLIQADDQAGIPTAEQGGVDRGLLRFLQNDGTGRFTDVTFEAFGPTLGAWMGLSFGDFDCDTHLDLFATNFGDYIPLAVQTPGRRPSRWLLGNADGTWQDPGVGALATTPFGWGTSTADLENDGDLDIVYHGGLDVGFGVEASNAGVVLENPGCNARFEHAADALVSDHGRRTVHGVAVGDLDRDGFVELVSVSNFDMPSDVGLLAHQPVGSSFDAWARFHLAFEPDPEHGGPVWVGATFVGGTVVVERRPPGANGWVAVRTLGTVDLVRGGRVNRDGLGAIVRFWPEGQPEASTMRPVVGGASYASQDALELVFGLGEAPRGVIEVLWPGGVRNRLDGVAAGERLVIPEIPCGYDDRSLDGVEYVLCVVRALEELETSGHLDEEAAARFLTSALRARREVLGDQPSPKARLALAR